MGAIFSTDAQVTSSELRHSPAAELKRRRAIIETSFGGMAAMAAVTALQTGIVRHLPDPPLRGFDSDRVNTSKTAYPFGVPDGTLSLLAFATNIPLAALGGANRGRKKPWIPLIAAGKALVEAAVAGWYFYQMPAREKAWCGYCITGAAASMAVAVLTIPEAVAAIRHVTGERG
jgi:uncharacterized membrane protein